MNDIAMRTKFVPHGCEHTLRPQPAVTLAAGTIWMQAYDAVTTNAGKYVQGGGCTTVGVAVLFKVVASEVSPNTTALQQEACWKPK